MTQVDHNLKHCGWVRLVLSYLRWRTYLCMLSVYVNPFNNWTLMTDHQHATEFPNVNYIGI